MLNGNWWIPPTNHLKELWEGEEFQSELQKCAGSRKIEIIRRSETWIESEAGALEPLSWSVQGI